jgi:hypothetical protein
LGAAGWFGYERGCDSGSVGARLRRPSGLPVAAGEAAEPVRQHSRSAPFRRPRRFRKACAAEGVCGRSTRRRDGGGNRRGSRRATSRRLPGNRHRLWGLSDADHRCRNDEREHGRDERSLTRRNLNRGSVTGRPTRHSTTRMTPHDCAPGTLSRRSPGYCPPTKPTGRWQKHRSLSSERAEKERFCHVHGAGSSGARATPSLRAARCHGFARGAGAAGGGVVSRMNRVSAATTAAASSSEAVGATIVSFGRRFTSTRAYRPASCPNSRCWITTRC